VTDHPRIVALRDNQRQLDIDGCEVGVSRQALDETLALYEQLLAACKELDESAPIDSEWGCCSCCSSQNGHTPHCPVEMARAAISRATVTP
jgi:hypothetical protein